MALAGWQANTILVWNSGSPYSITDNFTGFGNSVFNGIGGGPTRPNQIAPGYASRKHSIPTHLSYRPSAPSETLVAIACTARTSGISTSIFKDFALSDRARLQFRAESFNLTNTPNYFVANNQNDAATTNAVQGSGFGKIVTTNPNYTPRTLQLAVKLLF